MVKVFARWIPHALVLALGAAAPAAGCSTVNGASVCEQWCTCEGCSQSQRQDCESSFAKGAKLSEDKGCPELYDAFLGCIADHLQCVGDRVDIDACEAEESAMKKCTGGPCDELIAKEQACCEAQGNDPSSCKNIIDQQNIDGVSDEVCEAALNAISCGP